MDGLFVGHESHSVHGKGFEHREMMMRWCSFGETNDKNLNI